MKYLLNIILIMRKYSRNRKLQLFQPVDDSHAVNMVGQRLKVGFQILDLDGTVFLKVITTTGNINFFAGRVYNRVHIKHRAQFFLALVFNGIGYFHIGRFNY